MGNIRHILRKIGEDARQSGPVVTVTLSVLLAGAIGSLGHYTSWIVLFPFAIAGLAVGWAKDQAKAAASAELCDRLVAALTSGADTTITVDVNARPSTPEARDG